MSATTDEPSEEPHADQPSVLVVDEERVADLYADFLREDHDVTAVYGGEAALDAVDATVDVVLLDRRMPELPGDEVLDRIRSMNLDCKVAMVTAVEPDFDIIDMPFDEYLVKPVSRDAVRVTVERLLLREELDDVEYELGSLRVKRNVLEAEMTERELRDNEEFARLTQRIEDLRSRLSELQERLAGDVPGFQGTA